MTSLLINEPILLKRQSYIVGSSYRRTIPMENQWDAARLVVRTMAHLVVFILPTTMGWGQARYYTIVSM
jgi:hypothetical protein